MAFGHLDGGFNDHKMNRFLNRLGNLLIMIGLLMIMLFIFSDLAKDPQFKYFLYGFVSFLAGIILKISNKSQQPPQPTGRFRILKRRSQYNENDTDNS